MKIKELRKLPLLPWNKGGTYDQLLFVNSGKKHESGWAIIYIIGCIDCEPIEIVANCDDIYFDDFLHSRRDLYFDMYYPSGILRLWGHDIEFKIDHALSSTEIKPRIKIKKS
jgi:hypothetical protein